MKISLLQKVIDTLFKRKINIQIKKDYYYQLYNYYYISCVLMYYLFNYDIPTYYMLCILYLHINYTQYT